MAHPTLDLLNRKWGVKPVPCSKECEYFKFPHLKRACVLSDVFSVLQGKPCCEFKPKNLTTMRQNKKDACRQPHCTGEITAFTEPDGAGR